MHPCMFKHTIEEKPSGVSRLHYTLPLHPPNKKYRESAIRKTTTIIEQPKEKRKSTKPLMPSQLRTGKDPDGGVPARGVVNCARYRQARKCAE